MSHKTELIADTASQLWRASESGTKTAVVLVRGEHLLKAGYRVLRQLPNLQMRLEKAMSRFGRKAGISWSVTVEGEQTHQLYKVTATPSVLSAAMVAEACREVATPEECAEIAALPLAEAIGHAVTVLDHHGIEDPELFLKGRRVLE